MKHQNFVYKIRSRYIILHTHKQTITKFFFSEEKIQKFYLALDIHEVNSNQVSVEISISNLVKSKT